MISVFVVALSVLGYYTTRKDTLSLPSGPQINTTEQWATYEDPKYHYAIHYPAQLIPKSKQPQEIVSSQSTNDESFFIDGGVAFSQADDYGVMGVSVFTRNKFSSLGEWLKNENGKFPHRKRVVQRELKIDGYDAIVTYVESEYENADAYKSEKTLVFIKDGIRFEILTRFGDETLHENVWGSFRFIK